MFSQQEQSKSELKRSWQLSDICSHSMNADSLSMSSASTESVWIMWFED